MLITRKKAIDSVNHLLKLFPVVALIGPRQCGKTTLAKQFSFNYFFDLENPRDLARFDNPLLTLEKLEGTIVIDEIQRKPELFPLLRHIVDQDSKKKFLILRSASRELLKQSSEDLSLDHLWVIYPGKEEYQLEKNITVLPLDSIAAVFT